MVSRNSSNNSRYVSDDPYHMNEHTSNKCNVVHVNTRWKVKWWPRETLVTLYITLMMHCLGKKRFCH